MAECKIIGLSNLSDKKAYTYHDVEDGVTVWEYKGYDKELNKYLSAGWKIEGITYNASTLYVALVR